MSLGRRVAAESIGTALLVLAVIGSGIMAEHLARGNAAIALLANAIATGGALVAIILAFGPVSGAHLNPVVSLADAWRGGIPWREVPAYIAAQVFGAAVGAIAANVMFGLAPVSISHHVRAGAPLWLSEFVATFGLLAVIWGCARTRPHATPYAVAAYIVGAYWWSSSTSFANPAVTVARSLTDTFTGIRPLDIGPFVIAQLLGAAAGTALFLWLSPPAAIDEEAISQATRERKLPSYAVR